MVLEVMLMCMEEVDNHIIQDHHQAVHHIGAVTLRQDIHKVDNLHTIIEITQHGEVAEVVDTFMVTEAHRVEKGA